MAASRDASHGSLPSPSNSASCIESSTDSAFGMLVLASPDPQRFESGLATDFLERIAELASAALSRLRKQ